MTIPPIEVQLNAVDKDPRAAGFNPAVRITVDVLWPKESRNDDR
jgi:hypothetical protein